MSASAIYEGVVRHRRFAVHHHELRHRLALAYIDLDELPDLLGGRLLARRPGLVRFRRSDYLGDPSIPLSDAVRDTVHAQSGIRPEGPIRLLTHLRTCGHCFNPVSFYYCLDPSGERVQSALAEVTNTPWGERHAYVLAPEPARDGPRGGSPYDPSLAAGPGAVLGGSVSKALHVSPFMGMDYRYEWRLTAPARTLSVHIASHREGRVAFDATLALHRRELTRASLAHVTARYPFATLRVLTLIYAHGAALKLKGVPLHPRPRAA
ncbi:MAG TPA: DUF1365 domain-containing protein [Solirubrobacteraceae bacterium]